MMEFSSSSKRAKTPAGGNDISIRVSCLVDGCNTDLGQCREYHRRHKVCELHSKTPKVTIGGQEQRFCQQCSRFHSLVEFDEGKRSCRKRLDGHNRRRRKPQSESRTTTTFLSSQQGIATILSFNRPPTQISAMVGSGRATGFKQENLIGPFNNQPPVNYLDRHHLKPESSPPPAAQNSADIHFNFFQHRSPSLVVSSDHLSRAGNSHALSLLSSPPPAHQTPEIMPPIPNGLGQYGFVQEMHNEAVLSGSSGTTLQFQGMFHDDQGDSSSSGIKQQTLSFRWD